MGCKMKDLRLILVLFYYSAKYLGEDLERMF